MIAKSFAQSKGERKEALVTSMGDHVATHTTALLLVFQYFLEEVRVPNCTYLCKQTFTLGQT